MFIFNMQNFFNLDLVLSDSGFGLNLLKEDYDLVFFAKRLLKLL